MRLLWLADELRDAGLPVVEVPGWKTRGYEFTYLPSVVVQHHTAGSPKYEQYGPAPSLRVVTNGRSDLPGPLAQLLPAHDGTIYVVASGKANHAGPGDWAGVTYSSRTIGLENEHPGYTQYVWPAAQVRNITIATAVILNRIQQMSSMTCAHREWANPPGRKPDPVYGAPGYLWDMGDFRARVHHTQQILKHQPPEEEMATLVKPNSGPSSGHVFMAMGNVVTHLRNWAEADHYENMGVLKDKTVQVISGDLFALFIGVGPIPGEGARR